MLLIGTAFALSGAILAWGAYQNFGDGASLYGLLGILAGLGFVVAAAAILLPRRLWRLAQGLTVSAATIAALILVVWVIAVIVRAS